MYGHVSDGGRSKAQSLLPGPGAYDHHTRSSLDGPAFTMYTRSAGQVIRNLPSGAGKRRCVGVSSGPSASSRNALPVRW